MYVTCHVYILTVGPPRGGPRGALRGGPRGHPQRGRGQGRKTESPLKFEEEFDFEEANAHFNKEEIERELKQKLTISEYSRSGI